MDFRFEVHSKHVFVIKQRDYKLAIVQPFTLTELLQFEFMYTLRLRKSTGCQQS
jgi:hypothetical protein